jgi:hypothetical protein
MFDVVTDGIAEVPTGVLPEEAELTGVAEGELVKPVLGLVTGCDAAEAGCVAVCGEGMHVP